ncbi:cytochrome P450, partial [Auricularia subglabra TFB-10046 SS5]
MPTPTDALVCASLLFVAGLLWSRSKSVSSLPLPPGPPRHWLLGNLKNMPQLRPWHKFQEWASIYGPVMSLSLPGGKTMVVLNTIEAINDLLEKKSAAYSDRPTNAMAELMGYSTTILLQQDGPALRTYRRMCRMALGPSAASRYRPIQQETVARFVKSMSEHHAQVPEGDEFYMGQLRLSAVRSVMGIVYGIDVDDANHEAPLSASQHVKNAEFAAKYFAAALTPGHYLVNSLKFLRYVPEWFPGASFQRDARLGSAARVRMGNLPFQQVIDEMKSGSAPPSFVAMLLDRMNDPDVPETDKYDPEAVKTIARSMYNAGVDTTNSTLRSFVAAMLLHPDVQKNAQAELDSVVGRGHIPEIQDKGRLSYVNAVVSEVLRWQPPIPFGIPHRTIGEDDIYKGYLIPKHATVIANVWNVLHNGPVEQRLDEFDPSRYLDPSRNAPDPTVVFGFGRRICVGQLVAENMIFLMVAAILSAFTILPPKGEEGDFNIQWGGNLS